MACRCRFAYYDLLSLGWHCDVCHRFLGARPAPGVYREPPARIVMGLVGTAMAAGALVAFALWAGGR